MYIHWSLQATAPCLAPFPSVTVQWNLGLTSLVTGRWKDTQLLMRGWDLCRLVLEIIQISSCGANLKLRCSVGKSVYSRPPPGPPALPFSPPKRVWYNLRGPGSFLAKTKSPTTLLFPSTPPSPTHTAIFCIATVVASGGSLTQSINQSIN